MGTATVDARTSNASLGSSTRVAARMEKGGTRAHRLDDSRSITGTLARKDVPLDYKYQVL